MTREAVREHLHEQAALCHAFGSPFTGQLVERMALDFEAEGPVASLLADWPRDARADALAVRLAGALHAAALTGRDRTLASEYPEQRSDWSMDALWPLAHALLERDQAWVAEFIASPPQTNEVRRSIALLPGFLAVARGYDGELDLLELGASAGLNLHWDRFHYRTESWSWGPADGVAIDTEWHGPPPELDASPRVHARAACDQNPLSIADRAQRLRLRSYIWADQRDRLERFDRAADLAIAAGVQVDRADAAEWLAPRLDARASDRATVVYHSVFLQYPRRATRAAITEAITTAGERATAGAPLCWLRFEPEAMLGGPPGSNRYLVDLITWPGAVRRTLAVTDGHTRAVYASDALTT